MWAHRAAEAGAGGVAARRAQNPNTLKSYLGFTSLLLGWSLSFEREPPAVFSGTQLQAPAPRSV